MKMRRIAVMVACAGALLLCAAGGGNAAVPNGPAAFGADSATLTHPSRTMSVGDVIAYAGYGANRGDLRVDTAETTAELDGVTCLVVSRDTRWSTWAGGTEVVQTFQNTRRYWLAQDDDGNVWLLQFTDWDGTTSEFWRTSYVLDLPAAPAAGDRWTDLKGSAVEVLSAAASLGSLPNGLGPYSGCLLLRITEGGGNVEEVYFAPGVGSVYTVYEDGGVAEGWERVVTATPQIGPGSIEFVAAEYPAREGVDFFQVTLVRTGGSEGVVWVQREVTESVAATNPGIYYRDAAMAFFAPGQTALTVDVRLNDDEFWSHQRTMTLTLSEPGGGATLGARTSTTVVVQDDESGEDGGAFIGPCFLDALALP